MFGVSTRRPLLPARKINNPDYENISIEPFEVSIRNKIGAVVSIDDIDNIGEHIESTLEQYTGKVFDNDIYSLTKSAEKGAALLNEILNEK